MARNASGTHSLPAGSPVTTGTTISSVAQNALTSDISAEITDSLSRSGKGGMTAPLRTADGSVAAPAVSFTSETGSGFYRAAANVIGWAIAGVQRLRATATGAVVTGTFDVSGAGSYGGALDMNAQKITELANGSADQDAVSFVQACKKAAPASIVGANWTATAEAVWKQNGTVSGTIKFTAGAGAAWTSIGVLPVGHRPIIQIDYICGLTYDSSVGVTELIPTYFRIATDGVISAQLRHIDGATKADTMYAIGNNDVAYLNFSFIVA